MFKNLRPDAIDGFIDTICKTIESVKADAVLFDNMNSVCTILYSQTA